MKNVSKIKCSWGSAVRGMRWVTGCLSRHLSLWLFFLFVDVCCYFLFRSESFTFSWLLFWFLCFFLCLGSRLALHLKISVALLSLFFSKSSLHKSYEMEIIEIYFLPYGIRTHVCLVFFSLFILCPILIFPFPSGVQKNIYFGLIKKIKTEWKPERVEK